MNEFVKKVQNKEIDIVEHTHKVLEECKKINKEYNYFNEISENLALEQANNLKKKPKGSLAGVAVSIKDCICVKDVETRSGSKILNGYKPVFNATVIEKINAEGAIIIGKTSQDEFGFGGFNTNVGVDFKIPLNPFDKTRACGGSSGGSAGITQLASFPHLSLSESTGGSIVNPSSFCGVYGLCPTYGRVSRYGLLDYANSLDKIGPMAKNVKDLSLAQEIISGYDAKDSTSLDAPVKKFNLDYKDLKIGIIKEAFGNGVDDVIIDTINDKLSNFKTQSISLPLSAKYGIPTYYLIATSEASTNLAKYCGMRYGISDKLESSFNEYFKSIRSNNLGKEAKRRIIIGTFARMAGYRDAFYIKSAKVRTKIIQEYKLAFKKVDVLISPTVPMLPPKFEDIDKLTLLQNYMIDVLTVGPNLAGLPHLNVPVGKSKNLPIGAMLIGNHLDEEKLLQLGGVLNG